MKKIPYLVFILLVSILYSCAGNFSTVKQNTLLDLEKPKADTARVIFIRPARGLAGVSFMSIYDQNHLIGILAGSSYFTYNTRPGLHIFGSLFITDFDFLHAELESGKTYYVFCSRIDKFIKLVPIIVAVKKDSKLMQKVPGWLPDLDQAELTDEGTDQLKVRQDENGKFVMAKPGSRGIRKDIEKLRENWMYRQKMEGKERLTIEDGL